MTKRTTSDSIFKLFRSLTVSRFVNVMYHNRYRSSSVSMKEPDRDVDKSDELWMRLPGYRNDDELFILDDEED